MKKALCVLLCALLLCAPLFGCQKKDDAKPDDSAKIDYTENVLVSQNFHVSLGMAYYYFQGYYASLQSYYGDYFKGMTGIDPEKKLKEQSVNDSQTVFAYFLEQLIRPNLKNMLCLNEAALAAGYEVEAAVMAKAKDEAKATDLSSLPYLTQDELVYFTELTTRASYYQMYLQDHYTYTDADYSAYADEQGDALKTAQYTRYTIKLSDLDDAAKETLTAKLDALKELHGYEAFVTGLTALLKELYPVLTDDQIAQTLESGTTLSTASASDTTLNTWAFEQGRAVGDVTYYKDSAGTSAVVGCLLRTPYYDESLTVNVRHILALTEQHESADGARAQAQQWYDAWLAGEKTEDSFAAMAKEKSEDGGSASEGGLYQNVTPGQMVDAFNNWCFDAARQSGDTGLVDTSYGTHIMYFSSFGLPRWKAQARTELVAKDYQKDLAAFSEKFELKENEELLNKIDI